MTESPSSGGIGFVGLLTLIFIVAKLLHVIDWPWLWVLAPLWIGAILWMLFIGGIIMLMIWLDGK